VEFTRKASQLCTVSVAHTTANYDEAKAVFEAGATHLTHLYNGMPTFHHRDPGTIGAAAECGHVIAELICDGLHIHPSAVRMAFKLFPDRMCLISDALRCCGMPDGKYDLGGQEVFLQNGIAKLENGTIAGSASHLYTCMVNAASYGVGVETAILAATLTPARQLGRDSEIGSIDTGTLADFVVCDEALQREAVYLGGVKLS
jgi:N-acetylglucosamine-6-phosphate deacetylase